MADRFGQRNRDGVPDLSVAISEGLDVDVVHSGNVFSAEPERVRESLGPGQLTNAEDPFLLRVRMDDPTLLAPGMGIGGDGREERVVENPSVASVPVSVPPEK